MKLRVFIGNLNLGNCKLGDMEFTNIGRFSFSEAQTLYPQLTRCLKLKICMYLFSNISLTLRFEDGVIEFGAKFTIQ